MPLVSFSQAGQHSTALHSTAQQRRSQKFYLQQKNTSESSLTVKKAREGQHSTAKKRAIIMSGRENT
eukprot:1617878-Ditylum_brightwellii.AAC.1